MAATFPKTSQESCLKSLNVLKVIKKAIFITNFAQTGFKKVYLNKDLKLGQFVYFLHFFKQ